MIKASSEAPQERLNETDAPANASRKQGHRFRKGQSGNPRGKLKGTRNRATRLAEALLEDEAVGLVRQVIDLAKAGDITALRLCLERLIPRRVERAIEFELPPISEPKDAVGRAVADRAGRGMRRTDRQRSARARGPRRGDAQNHRGCRS